ncbi:chromo' (CHRromatin Organization MOdifier) domain protein [Dictyocaulus viviparus]|uniref:Chromo' (CHRromatin Organization MOdifier) domain protein n=1 Tax=Dictyocaulus viviparus TaxID=29172 RepID=A0A0D8XPY1_DICVI|nr:chromo' (CHRromatin Organization MOdifier) domain protein [Dictyocaulus viviparus]
MDEGDEYVPQMSQLGDYGGLNSLGMSQVSPPSIPGYPMSGGLTPMNNPYEQQMIIMGQPSQPVQKPAPTSKSRSKKKQDMDPMQSMAAMSNNPMMRPSMQQMGSMYPPQSGQIGMYGGAGPPQQPPHFTPQGNPGYRPQYVPQPGYPGIQQPMYPSQQTQQQRATTYGGPQPPPGSHYGYGAPSQSGYPQQYAPQIRPQYPQGQQTLPMQNQYWEHQQHPYYQQQSTPQSGSNLRPGQMDQWNQQSSQQIYHLEMEMRGMQQRLQHLYQQQRSPMVEQELQQVQMRLQYLQAEHNRLQMNIPTGQTTSAQQPLPVHAVQQQQQQPQVPQQMHPGITSIPNTSAGMSINQQLPAPVMGPPSGPNAAPPNQQVVIQQSPSVTPTTPVQVTQSGSQVQVNIKPETSGRTLISVYHRYGESPNGDEGINGEAKDSVPPEPTPTQQQKQYQAIFMHSLLDPQQLIPSLPQHIQQQILPQHSQLSQQHQPHNVMAVQQQAPSHIPTIHQPPSIPLNGMDSSFQNGVQHLSQVGEQISQVQLQSTQSSGLGDQKPLVYNPYADSPMEAKKVADDFEKKYSPKQWPDVSSMDGGAFPLNEEANVKFAPSIPDPLIRPSVQLFDDRDDATPPMRNDLMQESEPTVSEADVENGGEKGLSLIYMRMWSAGGDAFTDCSTLSNETQPALVTADDFKDEEETHLDDCQCFQKEDEKSVDTTVLAIVEDEELKTEREVQKCCDLIPGTSSSRDPSTEESEVNESEPPSVKSSRKLGKKNGVAISTKEEINEERDATPSEIAESTDGVFTEPSTPAPESRKPRRLASRKKKSVDDSGDDDDDFVPEGRNRKISKKAHAKAVKESGDDDDRRSVSKWTEVPDTGDDDADDSILTNDSQEKHNDHQIVEKILNCRGDNDSSDLQYLVKWKGKAYVHCEWKTLKELEEIDKRALAKVKRFRQKKSHSNNDLDDEDFNSDYTVVDRVVDIGKGDDGLEYALVKWKSLAYDEVTWEPIESIPEIKLSTWKKQQIIDKAKVKEKPRPKANEWAKMPVDIIWKDGNTLREYQFEGVDWLLYCYYNERNCILADEMGLGKTVQTITFLSQVYDYGIHGPFLIVVPLSTIHNWVREFETWTDMNAVVYHGSQHSRDIIQQYEIYYAKQHSSGNKASLTIHSSFKALWRKNLVKLDALITTFEMVVTDCEFLRKIPFRVCVIDEAHRLKNRNCKLLTGG